MKSGAIFDMDGLLFDTEKIYRDVWNHLPEEFGMTNDPTLGEAVCGTSGEHLRKIVQSRFPEIDADAFVRRGLERVEQTVMERQPEEKPGVHEILDDLKSRGLRLAVASGSPEAVIQLNLERAGLTGYFDAVVSGFSVPHGKPAPDIFLESARRIGSRPEDCYVFEDGANGIRAAASAGCTPVMIPDLTEPDEQLEALCAGVYPTLLDALRAIQIGTIE